MVIMKKIHWIEANSSLPNKFYDLFNPCSKIKKYIGNEFKDDCVEVSLFNKIKSYINTKKNSIIIESKLFYLIPYIIKLIYKVLPMKKKPVSMLVFESDIEEISKFCKIASSSSIWIILRNGSGIPYLVPLLYCCPVEIKSKSRKKNNSFKQSHIDFASYEYGQRDKRLHVDILTQFRLILRWTKPQNMVKNRYLPPDFIIMDQEMKNYFVENQEKIVSVLGRDLFYIIKEEELKNKFSLVEIAAEDELERNKITLNDKLPSVEIASEEVFENEIALSDKLPSVEMTTEKKLEIASEEVFEIASEEVFENEIALSDKLSSVEMTTEKKLEIASEEVFENEIALSDKLSSVEIASSPKLSWAEMAAEEEEELEKNKITLSSKLSWAEMAAEEEEELEKNKITLNSKLSWAEMAAEEEEELEKNKITLSSNLSWVEMTAEEESVTDQIQLEEKNTMSFIEEKEGYFSHIDKIKKKYGFITSNLEGLEKGKKGHMYHIKFSIGDLDPNDYFFKGDCILYKIGLDETNKPVAYDIRKNRFEGLFSHIIRGKLFGFIATCELGLKFEKYQIFFSISNTSFEHLQSLKKGDSIFYELRYVNNLPEAFNIVKKNM